MCVIGIYKKSKPSYSELLKMERTNPDGGGIAYIEGKETAYKKGLKANEIYEITKKIKLPFVVHFRIGTVGKKSKYLCHPFIVDNVSTLKLEGKGKQLLFHNGHWGEWKAHLLQALPLLKGKIIEGELSDSRCMAILGSLYGRTFYHLIEEKIAILSSDGVEVFGSGWSDVEGNLYSNLYFDIYPNYNYKTIGTNRYLDEMI